MRTITILKIPTRWLGVTVVAALLAGTITGCSSGGDASPATVPTATPTSAAGPPPPPGPNSPGWTSLSAAVTPFATVPAPPPGRLTKQQLIAAADRTCHAYSLRVEISYDDGRLLGPKLRDEQKYSRLTFDHLDGFRLAQKRSKDGTGS